MLDIVCANSNNLKFEEIDNTIWYQSFVSQVSCLSTIITSHRCLICRSLHMAEGVSYINPNSLSFQNKLSSHHYNIWKFFLTRTFIHVTEITLLERKNYRSNEIIKELCIQNYALPNYETPYFLLLSTLNTYLFKNEVWTCVSYDVFGK